MFSRRSIISLGQYFSLQEIGTVELLFIKHGVLNGEPQNRYLDYAAKMRLISEILQNAEADRLESVMAEVVRSQGSFRNRVAPRYMYDERWQDVQICLSLDGYITRTMNCTAQMRRIESPEVFCRAKHDVGSPLALACSPVIIHGKAPEDLVVNRIEATRNLIQQFRPGRF